jgi:Ca2+-binding RTX toxin-like protein
LNSGKRGNEWRQRQWHGPVTVEQMANQQSVEQSFLTAQAVVNSPPDAADTCVVTTEGTAIGVPALARASDPDGDAIELASVSMPPSGRIELAPDGSLTFIPDQPGLQRFTYQVTDGRGGTETGQATVFVNPSDGELDRPVLEGLDDQQLARLAVACAGGQALEVETLTGPSITVPVPAPGERIDAIAQPGQQINLQGGEFVSATYLITEGGLLVLTEDGRMVYVADLVAAANSGQPPTLRVTGGPSVASDVLLTNLQPLAQAAEGDVVGRLPSPQSGPEHWGGANFSPYDPGAIGAGLVPTGPLLPTALGLGVPPVLENRQALVDEGGGGQGSQLAPAENAPPRLSIGTDISAQVGEVTRSVGFASGQPFPDLSPGRAVDLALINGVDQDNLVLGPAADARIIFRDEFAAFKNTLGVVLIGDDGQLIEPRIVFALVEHADRDPQFLLLRPGGGPLSPGDEVRLSELYIDGELAPGVQFAFFTIAEGFRSNGDLSDQELVFLSNGQPATIDDSAPALFIVAPDGSLQPVEGRLLHTASASDDPLVNALNDGGRGQVLSGLEDDAAGLSITFEDIRLDLGDTGSDNDFDDVTFELLLEPSTVTSLDFLTFKVAADATIEDIDDASLTGASVAISDGFQPNDALLVGLPLEGTGVTLVADPSGQSLELVGAAPVATYQEILRSIELDPAGEGVREITFQVTDARGALSQPVTVTVNLTPQGAQFGDDADNILEGEFGVNDAIAGRDGNDVLLGFSGDDVLDGGLGNDELQGGSGDDLLIGGPGTDRLIGDGGADRHLYFSLEDRGDRIFGFDAAEGDTLDFGELFAADPADVSNDIDSFVRFGAAGNDVQVSVDQDGGGGDFAFTSVVTLVDPSGVSTAQDAVANGSLVV